MIDPQLLVAVTGFVNFVEGDPKYLTIADMERARQIPRKIRLAVDRFVRGSEWGGLDLERVDYSYKKLSAALDQFDASDVTNTEKMLSGLPSDPELEGGYTGALQRVVNYVTDKRPANADITMAGIRNRVPAPIEVYRWGRCVTIAEDPLYVLEWLHQGRLTSAAVECLTACYPMILDEMTRSAVVSLGRAQLSSKWRLPRDKERQLALLIGDFSAPGLQKDVQAVVDQAQQQKTQRSPSVSSTSKVSKSMHSTSREL